MTEEQKEKLMTALAASFPAMRYKIVPGSGLDPWHLPTLAEASRPWTGAEQRRDYWMGRANENHSLASEARAEAAALREAATAVAENARREHTCWCTERHNHDPTMMRGEHTWPCAKMQEALSQPGPGAALLERVRKLEKVADAARNHDCVEKPTCRICEAVAAFDAKETP